MARLGVHPRLARLLLWGRERGQTTLACELAVLLSERDPLNRREAGCDLLRRLDWLRRQPSHQPLQRLRRQWQRQLEALPAHPEPVPAGGATATPVPAGNHCSNPMPEDLAAALLVAAAFPERLALGRTNQPGRYLLRSGSGAELPADDPLSGHRALAVASLDGAGPNARIQLALPLPEQSLLELAGVEGEEQLTAHWDAQGQRVRCERCVRLGALVLERRPWPEADGAAVQRALLAGLRLQGLACLPWTAASRQLQHRLTLAHRRRGAPWPDRSDGQLLAALDHWLGPWLEGITALAELQQQLDLEAALWGDLPWPARQELERLLPSQLPVPSGRLVHLDYSSGAPVLAVKLQELFGCKETPTVLDGSLPVTLHLLTPAGRPAAITQDLAGFWGGAYREVRRDLRGRYPKHPWPEDGATAQATGLTKARLAARPS